MFNKSRLKFCGVLLSTMVLFLVMIGFLLWSVGAFPVRAATSPLNGGSYKAVDVNDVPPGGIVAYTIVLSNSSGSQLDEVVVTDTLDYRLTYDSHDINPDVPDVVQTAPNQVVFTLLNFQPNSVVTLSLFATLTDTVASGEIITNTAIISDPESIFPTNPVTFTVSRPPSIQIYDPDSGSVIRKQPGETVKVFGRTWVEFDPPPFPNPPVIEPIENFGNDGNYTVRWSAVSGAANYVLQESDDGTFENPTVYPAIEAPDTSYFVSGKDNGTYAYRVAAYDDSDRPSRWSNVQTVNVDPDVWNLAARQKTDVSLDATVMVSVSMDGGSTWYPAVVTDTNQGWWDWSHDWEIGPERREEAVVLMARAYFAGGGGWNQDAITVTLDNRKYYTYYPLIFKRYPPIPYAPKTFYAEGVNDGDANFTLVWDYGYTDYTPTRYELDESTDDSNWTRIASNLTGDRYSLSRSSGTYYYRIRGVNDFGPSEWTYLGSPVVMGYFDDFSNPNSGWHRGVHYIDDRPVFDRAYENGSYRMKILLDTIGWNNRKIGWAKAPYTNRSSSYTVQVDHRFAEAEDQDLDPSYGKAGLVFGANGDFSTVYVFEWSWEGRCAVSRYDNVDTPVSDMNYLLSQWTTYKNWGVCDPLRTGYNQINTIRVDVQGNGARFYINGSEIQSDNPGGINAHHQVGLMSGSWERTPIESRFDNFKVEPK